MNGEGVPAAGEGAVGGLDAAFADQAPAADAAPASGAAAGEPSGGPKGGAAAVISGPQPPAGALRCLDSSHPRGCAACKPAPLAHELSQFALHSERGPRDGEQRLRRLLLASPEWNDPASRDALAAHLDVVGDGATAEVLRAHSAPSLRKPSMAALCRGWGYRCDVFLRKPPPSSVRARSKPRAAAAAAAGVAGADTACGGGAAAPPRAKRPRPAAPPGAAFASAAAAAVASLAGTVAGGWADSGAAGGGGGGAPAGTAGAPRAAAPAGPAAPPPTALALFRDALEGPVMAAWATGLRHHAGPGCEQLGPGDRAGLRGHDLRARLVDNARSGAAAQLANELFAALAQRHAADLAGVGDGGGEGGGDGGEGGGGGGGEGEGGAPLPGWALDQGPGCPLLHAMHLLDTWLTIAAQGARSMEALLRGAQRTPFTPAQELYTRELNTALWHMQAGMADAHRAAAAVARGPPAERGAATVLFESAARDLLHALARSLATRSVWIARFADELEGEPWLGVAEERTNAVAAQLLTTVAMQSAERLRTADAGPAAGAAQQQQQQQQLAAGGGRGGAGGA